MPKSALGKIHSLADVERAIRKLIAKRFHDVRFTKDGNALRGHAFNVRLANQLSLVGDWPRGIWASQGTDAPFVPQYERIEAGISAYLLTALIWPNGPNQDASNCLHLWSNGKARELGSNDVPCANELFFHCDPAPAFKPDQAKQDVIAVSSHHLPDYPFLNHHTWTVHDQMNAASAQSDWEYQDLRQRWEKIKAFSGGELVYLGASGRKNRLWRAPSEVARKFDAQIDKILKSTA
ncbi:MAG: hypothetical protein CSA70_00320 [Rhodobacterales bacterium]|nr:MAG: hypothetical protein CSA70_00320 [Rhodobacterales bacterium]